jgi:hypothetical protein
MNILINPKKRLHGGKYVWEVQELRVVNDPKTKERLETWVSEAWLTADLGKALVRVGQKELLQSEDIQDAIHRLARLEQTAVALFKQMEALGGLIQKKIDSVASDGA